MVFVSPLLAFLAVVCPCLASAVPGAPKPSPSKKCPLAGSGLSSYESFTGLVDAIYNRRDSDALRTYFDPDYAWHELNATRGVDAAVQFLKDAGWAEDMPSFQSVVPPCSANDRAVVHYRFQGQKFPELLAAMEMFRFEGPCVAEYWGVFQNIPPGTRPDKFFNDNLKAKAVVPQCAKK